MSHGPPTPSPDPSLGPLRAALILLRLGLSGWRAVPGFSFVQREADGGIYVALLLERGRG